MRQRVSAWMPFFFGDYMRDTGHLSRANHGSYLMLIGHAWTHDGVLPGDSELLRLLAKCERDEWPDAFNVLIPLFYKHRDNYRHKRVDIELKRARKLTKQRSDAGKSSAESKACQRSLNSRCPGVDPLVDVSLERNVKPSPSPSPSEKKERKRHSSSAARATPPAQADLLPSAQVVVLPPNEAFLAFEAFNRAMFAIGFPPASGRPQDYPMQRALKQSGGLAGWLAVLEKLRGAVWITSGGCDGFSLKWLISHTVDVLDGRYDKIFMSAKDARKADMDQRLDDQAVRYAEISANRARQRGQ